MARGRRARVMRLLEQRPASGRRVELADIGKCASVSTREDGWRLFV